jgi:hypothetical protein
MFGIWFQVRGACQKLQVVDQRFFFLEGAVPWDVHSRSRRHRV